MPCHISLVLVGSWKIWISWLWACFASLMAQFKLDFVNVGWHRHGILIYVNVIFVSGSCFEHIPVSALKTVEMWENWLHVDLVEIPSDNEKVLNVSRLQLTGPFYTATLYYLHSVKFANSPPMVIHTEPSIIKTNRSVISHDDDIGVFLGVSLMSPPRQSKPADSLSYGCCYNVV